MLERLVSQFDRAKVLVLGDIIVDRYIFGTVSRISPEAPVPVVDVERNELRLGGAANVFNNVRALGAQAVLSGVVGRDRLGDYVLERVRALGSTEEGVVRAVSRRTTTKTRIVAHSQQVVRYDVEDRTDVGGADLDRFFAFFDARLAEFDAIIVSDYIKGVVGTRLMGRIREHRAHNGDKPLVVDPKPRKPERFVGATLVTPNQSEAEKMAGVKITDLVSLDVVGERLLTALQTKAVLITRGERGMALFEPGKRTVEIPTAARKVFDVTGAGDTAVAAVTLGLVAGGSYLEAARLGNLAAGIVVEKVGTETTTQHELLARMAEERER